MRIGMLTTGYPHEGDPVAGAFVREMACALAQRGHSVRVLCAERPGDRPRRDPSVDVRVVRYAPHAALAKTFYDAGAPDNLRRSPLAWAGAASFPIALTAAARRRLGKCDALVSHFVLPCALAGGLARAGRPHLAIAHGTDAHLLARAPAPLRRAVLCGATQLQVSHGALRDRLGLTPAQGARVSVAPMGYHAAAPPPPDARRALRASLGIDESHVVVLAVARLVPVKGLELLVEAAARVRGPLAVVVAGDGPERARLEQLARVRAAPVRFVGAVEASRRDALLGAADVFAAPSRTLPDGRTEGAPVAVLEAMGAGLAVIASRVGGLPELVDDAGLLIDADDAHSLARAMQRMIAEPAHRAALGRAARERVAPFAWTAQAARIEAQLGLDRAALRTVAR